MINNKNLNKIYESVIQNKELTTKELNSYGFNSKDLTKLIDEKIIQRIKKGHYSFIGIDNLFYYGKRMLFLKEFEKAEICFKKCYEINPNYSHATFQLFLTSINKGDYNKVFEYFDYLYPNSNYIINNNFFLYMLSMVTKLPKKYEEILKTLTSYDITNCHDKSIKEFRVLAYDQKFIAASKKLEEIIKKTGKYKLQNIVTMRLLDQAFKKQVNTLNNLIKLTKDKNYQGIVESLEEEKKHHILSSNENNILNTAKDIIKIKKTKTIPKKQNQYINNISDAIKGKDYLLALKLSMRHCKIKNNDLNVLNILLTDITKMINEATMIKLNSNETKIINEKNNKIINKIKPVFFANNLINEKRYGEIVKSLEKNEYLTDSEKCILLLSKDIINIIKTGVIPKKQVFLTNNLFEAINGKNYDLALSLTIKLLKIKKINFENNSIYLLLNDITNLINKIKKDLIISQKNQIKKELDNEIKIPNNSDNIFNIFINYLMKQDFDNSFIALNKYLNSIEKQKYEFLIINLIKISIIENDITFTKPMTILNYINQNNFEFNIYDYIQNFYEAISQNKLKIARIYLNIISNSKHLVSDNIKIEGLEQILNSMEKTINNDEISENKNKLEKQKIL